MSAFSAYVHFWSNYSFNVDWTFPENDPCDISVLFSDNMYMHMYSVSVCVFV